MVNLIKYAMSRIKVFLGEVNVVEAGLDTR